MGLKNDCIILNKSLLFNKWKLVKFLLPTKKKPFMCECVCVVCMYVCLRKMENQWNTKWDEFMQTVTFDMPHRTCIYVRTKLCNGGKGR